MGKKPSATVKHYTDYNEFKKDYNYNDPDYAFYYKFIKRPISYPLCWLVYKTTLSPNILTLFGFIFVIASAFLLTLNNYAALIFAALFFYIYELFDDFDGVVARSKKLGSKRGAWLDTLAGIFGKSLIMLGAAIGVYYSSGNPIYLLIGAVSIFGYYSYITIDTTVKVYFSEGPQRKLKFEEHRPNPRTLSGLLSIVSEMAMNLWYIIFFIACFMNKLEIFVIFSAAYYVLYFITQFFYRDRIYRKG